MDSKGVINSSADLGSEAKSSIEPSAISDTEGLVMSSVESDGITSQINSLAPSSVERAIRMTRQISISPPSSDNPIGVTQISISPPSSDSPIGVTQISISPLSSDSAIGVAVSSVESDSMTSQTKQSIRDVDTDSDDVGHQTKPAELTPPALSGSSVSFGVPQATEGSCDMDTCARVTPRSSCPRSERTARREKSIKKSHKPRSAAKGTAALANNSLECSMSDGTKSK